MINDHSKFEFLENICNIYNKNNNLFVPSNLHYSVSKLQYNNY